MKRAWPPGRFFLGITILPILLALGAVLLGGSMGAVAATSAQNCWSVSTAPAVLGQQIELKSISGLPNGEAWVVGNQHSGGVNFGGLVLHFNGSTWSQVQGPFGTGRLEAVKAITPDNVWVVGSTVIDQKIYTLVVHWDGSTWSMVPSPNPGAEGNGLAAISVLGPNDIWAAGSTVASRSMPQPLLIHWDGQTWTERPAPNLNGYTVIAGIEAISPNDVWAVGTTETYKALALHWDGTRWQSFPEVASQYPSELSAISALGSNDIWAVGRLHHIKGSDTLALHWDGTRWTRVVTPIYGSQEPVFAYSSLRGIAAVSPNDVWAVGAWGDRNTEFQPDQPFVLHWNGSYWGIAHETFSSRNAWLESVSMAGGKAVAVGSYIPKDVNEGRGLIMREGDIPCVIPSPTPTQTYTRPLAPIVTETPGGPPMPTAVVPLNPPVPVPGQGSRLFPETGKTMSGIFLDYWQKNGGLPQQGYPISNVIGEVSDLNGKLYTMQYTERAVFEHHPEYRPPFNVLLSQLGRFQYEKKYPAGAPGQKPNNDPGSVFFKETSKRLGGSFLEYWRANGGLMQQGYPISDEFVELSLLNGKPYTVQYFERAVFEYHPENARPYDVLLSHLGLFRYNEKYRTGTPRPTPPVGTPAPSTTAQAVLRRLPDGESVGGRFVLWRTGHGQVSTIDGYDLDQNRQFVVTTSATNKDDEITDGRIVVWDQDCPPYCHRLRAYDLQTGREYAISEPVPGRTYGKLWLDHGKLYYQKYEGQTAGLYEFDLSSGQERELYSGSFGADGMFRPVIADGFLLWMTDNASQTEWTLHMRKIDGSVGDTVLATAPIGFSDYGASGDNIVWSALPVTFSDPQTDTRAFVYNLVSRTFRPISTGTASNVQIKGDMVAWKVRTSTPSEQTRSAIEAHDISTGRTRTALPDRLGEIYLLGMAEGDRLIFREEVIGPSGYTWTVYALDLMP